MNFDILRKRNSYPEHQLSYDVEWLALNYALRVDAEQAVILLDISLEARMIPI